MLIAHISDIHIRNFARHWEYDQAFENLYNSLKEKKPDIIVLTGDTAHTKTKIAPEFVDMCANFYDKLGDIAKTFIIPGNHDGNLNNLSRLDAISPVVEALGHPNIHFLKDSGVYPQDGFNFVVFSCFDKDWPTEAPKGELNIGLYHGFVQNAELQNGMIVKDATPVQEFLSKVDYLLLGDIHKMQILDHKFRAAYAGSLIQQNYGESADKGYLLWDIESCKKHNVDFVKLPNICPFYTVILEDDLKIPKLNFQPRARIRVFSRQLSVLEKDMLKEKFTDLHDPYRLDFLDELSAHRQEVKLDKETTKIENLDDELVQKKLLKQFLKKYNLTDEEMEKVYDINRRYNAFIKKEDDALRNVEYSLGRLTWSNTFSYAEDNELDFSAHEGILGVFGKSGVGKSSAAVDIPLYCIFNKISKRVTKNDWIINENKEDCSARIEIKLGDKTYIISRKTDVYLKSGKKKGKPVYQGRTAVDFKVIHAEGTVQDLNGTERTDTDTNIRKVFGTPEDFVATSVAPQWKLLNLVEAGGTDRQKLIGRYFDIDIFEQKHALARDELKDIKAELNTLDPNIDLEKFEKDLKSRRSMAKKNDKAKKWLQENKKKLERVIQHLKDCASGLFINKASVEVKIEEATKELELQIQKVEDCKKISVAIREHRQELEEQQAAIDIDHYRKVADKPDEIDKLLSVNDSEMRLLKGNIKQHMQRMEGLKKYDCMSNPDCAMRQAREEFEDSLKSDEERLAEIEQERKDLLEEQQKVGSVDEAKKKVKEWENLEAQKKEIGSEGMTEKDLENAKEWKEFYEKELEENKKLLEKYKENEAKIAEIKAEIEIHEMEKREIEGNLDEALREALRLSKEIGVAETVYESKKASKEKYEALNASFEAYDYFMRAMSKDGIVREIISDNLGVINAEISKILSYGVGFTVMLESHEDGKAIDIFFKHERSPKRHIELCGGMEKTLAEVAIRAALVCITTLPRSNIFVLDESFGALDPEYMSGLTRILEYLKTLFETVIIITHKDELRDFVDHVIEVERDEQGYARLT